MSDALTQTTRLLAKNNFDEPRALAKLILEEVAGFESEDFALNRAIYDTKKVFDFIDKMIMTKAPVQHLLGYCHFMGEKYSVNNSTLIPRDETEFLVQEAIKKIETINKEGTINVLDIGCGTGIIACSIAKNCLNTEVLGVDISSDALILALNNALKLDLEKKALFRKSDVFSGIREHEKYDVIVSNPPYISESDYEKLDAVVKDFEPKSALVADDEGYYFYEKIIQEAPNFLEKNGYLLFELGINQAKKVEQMLLENGFCDVEITKDLARIERVILARLS